MKSYLEPRIPPHPSSPSLPLSLSLPAGSRCDVMLRILVFRIDGTIQELEAQQRDKVKKSTSYRSVLTLNCVLFNSGVDVAKPDKKLIIMYLASLFHALQSYKPQGRYKKRKLDVSKTSHYR